MIHEMTLHITKSGQCPGLVRRYGAETLPLRRSLADGGRFVGAWTGEFGPLNSFYELWEFADVAAQQAAQAQRLADARWHAHVRELAPLLESVETVCLKPFRSIAQRADAGRMYDFRIYTIKPFHADEYAGHFAGIMPVREKYSKNFCVWTPLTGNVHRVFHLWPYESPDRRLAVRGAMGADPAWQEFIAKVFPLIVAQTSSLLRPVPDLIE